MTMPFSSRYFGAAAALILGSSCHAFAPPRPANTASSSALSMFTGIVEEMGTVISLQEKDDMPLWDGSTGSGTELTLQSNDGIMLSNQQDAYLGCSICVSGVCLTATALDFDQNQFSVGLAPETLRRTHLGDLQAGQMVNLERASVTGGRNSGHFVQGHVDDTGTIAKKWREDDAVFFQIHVPNAEIMPYIVPQGFIAIDGTSLTVVSVDAAAQTFTFMLVNYTQQKIVVTQKDVGERVNLEVDVLGKYSQTALAALLPRLEKLEETVASLQAQLAEKEAA